MASIFSLENLQASGHQNLPVLDTRTLAQQSRQGGSLAAPLPGPSLG